MAVIVGQWQKLQERQFRWILCQFLEKLGWGNTNSPELLLLNFLSLITAISWPPPVYFTTFFNILYRVAPFFTAYYFWVDKYIAPTAVQCVYIALATILHKWWWLANHFQHLTQHARSFTQISNMQRLIMRANIISM